MSLFPKTLLALFAIFAMPAPAAPARIMCVGDSLTDTSPGYRGFLYDQLKSEGYDFEFVGPKKGKAPDGGALDHAGYGGYSIGPGPSRADEWWDPLESTCRHASLSIL